MRRPALATLDRRLLRTLRTRFHPPPVEAAVIVLARAGESGLLWQGLALMGAVLDGGRRPAYLRAFRAAVVALLANTAVKQLVRRPRPALGGLPPLTPVISERSYPSAHASTSFAGARVLSEVLPAAPLYGLAVAMALTRPYLGLHYPSDVVAGALLGEAVAELVP
jgi:undecaprenyl-diphosphatase